MKREIEWYTQEYLRVNNNSKYERKNKISKENFVRMIEDNTCINGSQALNTPVKIEWHITKKCNLKCKFCYSSAIEKKVDELSRNEIDKVINDIHKNNVLEVQIEGGEPFLHSELTYILKRLKENHIRVRLLTNGTVVNESVLKTVKELFDENDVLQVSLHGHDSETHDNIVGLKGSFQNVIRFFEKTEELNIATRVSCVVSTKNIQYLREMIELLLNYKNIVTFVTQPIIPIGRAEKKETVPKHDLLKAYYDLRDLSNSIHLALLLGHAYEIELLAEYMLKFGKKQDRTYCAAGRARLHIDESGNIYPCHFLVDEEFHLGNIRKDSFAKVWHGEKIQIIRNGRSEDNYCSKCKLKKNCTRKGLCTSYVNGGINNKPINCNINENMIIK